jgi:phage FluMu gp28-like protein
MDSSFKMKIAKALEELNSSLKPSLRAVEKKYGVSRRTLQCRLNDGVLKQITRCSQQLLSSEQEKLLVL